MKEFLIVLTVLIAFFVSLAYLLDRDWKIYKEKHSCKEYQIGKNPGVKLWLCKNDAAFYRGD